MGVEFYSAGGKKEISPPRSSNSKGDCK
uniref:Uncharacterized protein n=1 Tax=Anguilla anguilla TaxID=7936 RepID=A0A0E9TP64_ANGAN